ncbi:Zn-dependent alcohol dehydrogenase [Bradyrhizobium sp. SRL28]|uniref:Zn-dependent alcohol dehydrogenase n=1 Tax=Bradyrhizobium sp. SRL28 TaxID=2836178 RepID=UPI001BDF71D6|nr:Zn-dependent alcohol dehydrogenase [Bradyrhizobium sp. SRL28]MBT1516480.1 Zn-dependent alcohol dehydrogenase [Bradyrhizobium sp. SRL28]
MKFNAAVLFEARAPLAIESLKLAGLADADVLIRVQATSLCHTDLEAVQGAFDTPLPMVPGHEAAGVVEWIGKSVTSVQIGDHVVTSWNPHCGECFYCRRHQPILCEPYRARAVHSYHFDGRPRLMREGGEPVHQLMYSGSFAELCVVDQGCAVKVPREMPFNRACLIGCGVMTGVGAAMHIAKIEKGATVTVIGCGAVGLSAVQGARLAGASRVIAVDRLPGKLDLAAVVGATHTLLADDSIADLHSEVTSGRGADCVIEAAGSRAAFRASVEMVRPGGQVVWLGKLPANDELAFRWGSLMGEKRIVRSSYGGAEPSRDFPWLANAYLDGSLKLDEYVTSTIALADVNAGLARLAAGEDIRSVIEF